MMKCNSPEFYKDLPPELLNELTQRKKNPRLYSMWLQTLKSVGESSDLNTLLIAHYHLHGTILKRHNAIAYVRKGITEGVIEQPHYGIYKYKETSNV